MKKTRILGLFLAAFSCALSIPACGGGGEDGNTYASVRQFIGGAKAFYFNGAPSLTVYCTGGGKPLNSAGAQQVFAPNEYGGAADLDYVTNGGNFVKDVPDIEEGEFSQNGYIQVTGGRPLKSNVAYGVSGGETGRGYLYIAPQEGFDNGDSANTPGMVHFLGGVTSSDSVTYTSSGTVEVSDDDIYKHLTLDSLAGATYRVELDFATGAATFTLMYAASWKFATDQENAYIAATAIIDALRVTTFFFSQPR